MAKMRNVFKYIRADEIAECWEGVSSELSRALWALPQKPIPNLEDSGPADHVGHDALSNHWRKLSEAHQLELNALALRNE